MATVGLDDDSGRTGIQRLLQRRQLAPVVPPCSESVFVDCSTSLARAEGTDGCLVAGRIQASGLPIEIAELHYFAHRGFRIADQIAVSHLQEFPRHGFPPMLHKPSVLMKV